jgi:hypothetical protein
VAGDVVEHHFDGEHALGPAEAAEGGVGHRVGAAAQAADGHRVEVVGVVGVEHRAVVDRARQVGREAAAGGARRRPVMRPSGVEAHVVVDAEVVALAGGAHVVVAVEAQLDRPPAGPGEQRGDAGPLGGLRLLAAEAAAHPAAFAAHLVHAPAEGAGHRLLHLGGVLGGAEQVQAVVLAGDRAGDLAFEVVMLLAAVRTRPARRWGAPARAAATSPRLSSTGAAPRCRRRGRRRCQHGRQRLDAHHRQAGGAAGLLAGVGGDGEQRLAVEQHFAGGEDGVVVDHRAAVVVAGDVGGGDDGPHPGAARTAVRSRPIRRPWAIGQPDRGVQQAGRFGQVVGVGGAAGHVEVGALVGQGLADGGGRSAPTVAVAGAAWAAGAMSARRSGAVPQVSSHSRRSRPAAAWRR